MIVFYFELIPWSFESLWCTWKGRICSGRPVMVCSNAEALNGWSEELWLHCSLRCSEMWFNMGISIFGHPMVIGTSIDVPKETSHLGSEESERPMYIYIWLVFLKHQGFLGLQSWSIQSLICCLFIAFASLRTLIWCVLFAIRDDAQKNLHTHAHSHGFSVVWHGLASRKLMVAELEGWGLHETVIFAGNIHQYPKVFYLGGAAQGLFMDLAAMGHVLDSNPSWDMWPVLRCVKLIYSVHWNCTCK